MKRAALYARVSSDMQKKEGTIESQIAELRRQIKAAGDVIVKEYIDEGYSGASLDRPGMSELRQDLKRGIYDVIYALNTDRIARDVLYLNIVITDILIYKKRIIINGKDYIDNPENKFELTILGAVAELERAKIMERNQRGRMHKLQQGQLVGGKLFGYIYHPKTVSSQPQLEIDEPNAKFVRFIYESYARGNTSLSEIAQHLKEVGVKGEKIDMGMDRVRYILHNPTYAGTKFFNRLTDRKNKNGKRTTVIRDRSEWIGITVPAIISKELFEKVQERIRYNRECYRNARGTQPLSNLIFCAKCKRRCPSFRKFYSVKRLHKETYYKRHYFQCSTNGDNHNPQIDMRLIESCVREMLLNTVFNHAELTEHLDLFKERRTGGRQVARQLKVTLRKLQDIADQKERIVDLYAKGGIEQEEYYRRMTLYNDQTDQLQSDKKSLLQHLPLFEEQDLLRRSVETYSKAVKKRFDECMDALSWRQFFLDFVKRVEYDKSSKTVQHIWLYGSVSVRVRVDDEYTDVPVAFTIKKTLDVEEAGLRLREYDLVDGSIWGSPISKIKYDHLTQAV